jgi:hypothetical protein
VKALVRVVAPELTVRWEPVAACGYRDAARGDALVVERRWSPFPPWQAVPAIVPWLGIGIVLTALAARTASQDPRSSALLVMILLGWLAMTALLAWEALAGVVNRTRIVLDRHGLRVGHGPLPLASAATWALAREDVAGFAVELEPRGDLGLAHWVIARHADGSRLRLVEVGDAKLATELRDTLAAHHGGGAAPHPDAAWRTSPARTTIE